MAGHWHVRQGPASGAGVAGERRGRLGAFHRSGTGHDRPPLSPADHLREDARAPDPTRFPPASLFSRQRIAMPRPGLPCHVLRRVASQHSGNSPQALPPSRPAPLPCQPSAGNTPRLGRPLPAISLRPTAHAPPRPAPSPLPTVCRQSATHPARPRPFLRSFFDRQHMTRHGRVVHRTADMRPHTLQRAGRAPSPRRGNETGQLVEGALGAERVLPLVVARLSEAS